MVVLLAASLCFGQTTAPSAVGHGAFPVKVTKALDSSKLKEGDPVEVETAGSFKLPDGTVVAKGSKMMGHVAAAKARSKGDSDSQLSIAFEKLNLANGKQLSVKGVVQAVFPPADEVDPGVPSAASSHGGSNAPPPMPDYRPTGDIKVGSNTTSGTGAEPAASPKSVGVQGMHDLELGQDGMLSSKGKNVKLGSGVRMIIRAEILGS
jgi:hypothetical protein